MTITSYNPRTGQANRTIEEMSPDEVEAAVKRASDASSAVAAANPRQRRGWLHAVAAALVANTAELVELAEVETALGYTRLTSEISRAAGQLRFYGDVAAEGSYLAATIDCPTSTTSGLARVNQPLGPVAVFGASNFPFAFGVLGNDFGSALAAGCPVVAKSHPAHPLLSDRLAGLARRALLGGGAPDGSLEIVVGYDAGVALVRDEGVAALAFTGSQAAGLALWRIANERRTVIPTYAEMSTVNPVVVTRAAAATRMEEIAEGFVGSFTLGSGQFCTKPGLVFVPAGSAAVDTIGKALRRASLDPVMLTEAIAKSTAQGVEDLMFSGARVVELVEASVGAGLRRLPFLRRGSMLCRTAAGCSRSASVPWPSLSSTPTSPSSLLQSVAFRALSPPVCSPLTRTTRMPRLAWRCCRRRWVGCAPMTGRPVSHTPGRSNMAVRGRRPPHHGPRRWALPPWTGSCAR